MNLFDERHLDLLDKKVKPQFPKTRYQGSKYKQKEWIDSVLSRVEYDTVLDAFSGTSSVSYTLKKSGKQVFSNDLLLSNYITAKALVENNQIILRIFIIFLTKIFGLISLLKIFIV